LAQRIRHQKQCANQAVLAAGYAYVRAELRDEKADAAAVDVVDASDKKDEPDDPPAQPRYGRSLSRGDSLHLRVLMMLPRHGMVARTRRHPDPSQKKPN
jgi:hypothetical protein